MTLGGLALAVGILVDDATVMIENIDAHLATGAELEPAIIEAANQIVVPTFVSTLCICIVWLPLFQLSGVSGYLFLPLAEAIIFAMIASFILSRTLVPTMAAYHAARRRSPPRKAGGEPKGYFGRFQAGFERRFDRFRDGYRGTAGQSGGAARAIHSRVPRGGARLGDPARALARAGFLSRASNRARSTCISVRRSECGSRRPARSRRWWIRPCTNCCRAMSATSSTTAGCPCSGLNQAYSASVTIGPQDCDVTIGLNNPASPVDEYRAILRDQLPKLFPGTVFTFPPGDITAKILNFGLPAPIDVQIIGRDTEANMAYAQRVARQDAPHPGHRGRERSARRSTSRRC